MGLGCNAVGVTGCRIIQSPRERLIAVLTNSLMPCNGRWPLLITVATLFFAAGDGSAALCALFLVGAMALCVAMTLLCSGVLSKTVLRGMPSAFALELPPYRCPKIGQVLVRSLLDRTLFVLGRAAAVAAPAGAALWVLANVSVGETSLLLWLANALQPLGRLMGMDGAILLGFILGFPANELVLPIVLMIYLAEGTPVNPDSLPSLGRLLTAQGWTAWTAVSTVVFALFHWPCSTTVLTIAKETRSVKATLLAVLMPTALGMALCLMIGVISKL